MKPSSDAMFSYVLGLILIMIGMILFAFSKEIIPVLICMMGCSFLFIIGTQRDLYGAKE